MASQLRQVLSHFENQTHPQSITVVARQLDVSPMMLTEMIDYWIRKGRIRIVASNGHECSACGVQKACPFIMHIPRYYEVVREQDAHDVADKHTISDSCQVGYACGCGGACDC
jgi:hypothetical protein